MKLNAINTQPLFHPNARKQAASKASQTTLRAASMCCFRLPLRNPFSTTRKTTSAVARKSATCIDFSPSYSWLLSGARNCAARWHLRFFVASARVRDLFICANYLSVAAMVCLSCGMILVNEGELRCRRPHRR